MRRPLPMRRRPIRPQRVPVFIGCEGQSEVAYAAWLRNQVRDRDLAYHLELADLGRGAGDPLARVEMAIERVERWERNREQFAGRFIFLDTDQLAISRARAQDARTRAEESGFVIIWQEPTHEAFLLRHLEGHLTKRPATKRLADQALVKVWADYQKPRTPEQLEQRLQLEGAYRVSGTLPELDNLLRAIGLAPDGPPKARE